jgi:hypothetical protein
MSGTPDATGNLTAGQVIDFPDVNGRVRKKMFAASGLEVDIFRHMLQYHGFRASGTGRYTTA